MAGKNLWARIMGAVLIAIGALLLIGGGWLLWLGGSAYYLLAGLACVVSGVLIWQGRRGGVWLYAVFLLATSLWAIAEVGLQFWQLLPRIAGPAVIGALLVPLGRGKRISGSDVSGPAASGSGMKEGRAGRWSMAGSVLLAGLVLLISHFTGQAELKNHQLAYNADAAGLKEGEKDSWSAYGSTSAGMRFSPATQITPKNVAGLQPAWTYRTGETRENMPDIKAAISFMVTPLMVDDRLFFCTPRGVAVALDADTGAELWRFDPKGEVGDAQMLNCRGVSYHRGLPGVDGQCGERIIGTTIDGRLYAVDARDGRLCSAFGEGGYTSLKEGMGDYTPAATYTTSPPAIIGNVAVLGGYVRDNFGVEEPSGVVRGFDVITGRKVWAWDAGRPDENAPLGEGESYTRGSPNAWTVFSADPELGLVYVPMGNATPDHVGMHRSSADERYSSAIVALDAATGERRWHFQTVYHDLWDFDLPAQPVLFDMPLAGKSAPAVAVPTKQGEIYILDRRTGTPLVPVKEKPVPQGTIAGEPYSPVQPFSVGFPSFNPPFLKERDMWGATPLDQMWCRIAYRAHDYRGIYTPPSIRGTIQYPGIFGVLNWGSVSVDPTRNVMIVNSSAIPQIAKLYPRGEEGGQKQADNAHVPGYLEQKGTPYGLTLNPMLSPLGLPCHAPPWGHITAIDLNSRQILWKHPLGTSSDVAPMGIAVPGIFSIGGPITTASGLAFIAASFDDYLRAFDLRNGKELWRGRLPAGGQATPMTYTSGRTGRQYVVIAAGGHGFLGSTPGDYVMAFALGQKGD